MNLILKYIPIILVWMALAVPSKAYANVQKNTKRIYPVLLVEFEDVKFTMENPKAAFHNMLNRTGYNTNGASGCAADWLNANFKGICTFEFIVSDVITLPYPAAEFGAHSSTSNDSNILKMVREACSTMPEEFNLESCDTDKDGIVGNISIIYAGHSESEGGGDDAIWAHQGSMEGNPATAGTVEILSYTCTPELKGAHGDTISPPGTFCHEFAHYLGLPDMYDTNGENEGLSSALYGTLSIMDRGHFSNNGNTPPYLTSIEREILGIGTVEELLPDTTYIIQPLQDSKKLYRISTSTEGEYFLVEYRNGSGWDKYIGGKGMVIYHIDKSSNTFGGLTAAQRWEFNNINSFRAHECAKVLPAAGQGCPVDGAFFPGSNNVRELLSYRGNTRLKDWNGYAVGIGFEEISIQGECLSIKTIRDYSFNDTLPQAVDLMVMPYQKDARIEWRGIESKHGTRSNDLRWLVWWEENESGKSHSMVTDTSCCHINNLAPGKEYTFEIRAFVNREFGKAAVQSFISHPVTSPYPYISIAKEALKLGKEIDLRVFNLPPDVLYTNWYVNGKRLEKETIRLTSSGEIEITAGIGYKDGSYEKITKRINVK